MQNVFFPTNLMCCQIVLVLKQSKIATIIPISVLDYFDQEQWITMITLLPFSQIWFSLSNAIMWIDVKYQRDRTNKSYPCQLLIVFLSQITIVIYHKLQFSLSQNTQCVVPTCKMYLSEDCIWFNIFSSIGKSQLLQILNVFSMKWQNVCLLNCRICRVYLSVYLSQISRCNRSLYDPWNVSK